MTTKIKIVGQEKANPKNKNMGEKKANRTKKNKLWVRKKNHKSTKIGGVSPKNKK